MHKSTLELLNNFSILVVEDEDTTRDILKQELKEHFGDFYEAKNGLEGFEIFKKNRVDIIVTDISLPIISGFEMVREILKLKPKQLFIVVTSYNTNENLLKSIQNGAVSFLCKPLMDMKKLQTAILLALAPKIAQKHIDIGMGVTIDFSKEVAYKDNEPIFLSKTNNKIFWLLCYNLDMPVTYEMIEDYVYEGESVNKSAIHMTIMRIKKHLGVNIENVVNVGYVLKRMC